MKHCLWVCALLSACVPEPDTPKTTAAPEPPDSTQEAAAHIDAALMHDYKWIADQRLKWRNTPPLPGLPDKSDDSTFLRRACIDLAGRLPQPDEVRAFLADQSPAKRTRLTEALVREAGAVEVRFRMLAEAFRVKDDDSAGIGWLRKAAAEDLPYAEIVTHIIGGGHMRQRDQGNAIRTAVETAYTVLGEDIYCAMCHDHPFNDHTERECYTFAACFAGKDAVRLPSDYLYRDGKPGDVVQASTLRFRGSWWMNLRDDEDKLTQVARWMVQDEQSRRFALVASLRVWRSLFGMPGQMVDKTIGGVDDAPPWHGIHRKPSLNLSSDCFGASPRGQSTWVGLEINSPDDFTQGMKMLMEEFLRCGGRIGEFQRILARTDAYKRSGIDYNVNWNGCYLAPAPQIRRLPSEVIWTTLSGEVDIQLPQAPPTGHPLRMLGRGTREWTDESLTPVSHDLARFMIRRASESPISRTDQDVESLFLKLLGRLPQDHERQTIASQSATSQDIAWALLNTKEFMFRP